MAGEVTLELYNPCGALEAPERYAPRLDSLAGKTICELSNASWEPDRTFPAIREALQRWFPDTQIVPYTEFPIGLNQIDDDEIVDVLKQKGCQAVMVGNAG
ncbi:MAG: hypothetical protein HYX92_09320 [Chloroflexi bacterium]|nr:hypothetical protein [Chloroflexota bacterium]